MSGNVDDPCAWDNMDQYGCATCRKKHCPDCQSGMPCPSCVINGKQTCFAICSEMHIDFAQTDINYQKWQETYGAVRCQRSRNHQRNRGEDLFPGFCKQHASQVYVNIQRYWAALEDRDKDLVLYMVSTNQCNIANFDGLLVRSPYNQLKYPHFFDLLFSPMGLTSIDSAYFMYFLVTDLSSKIAGYGLSVIENVQAQGGSLLDAATRDMVNQTVMDYSEAVDYSYLVQFIAQPATMAWLNLADDQARIMSWNQLFNKLLQMFLLASPDEYPSMIRPFSRDWMERWDHEAVTRFGPLLDEPKFKAMWVELIAQMNVVATLVNRSMRDESTKRVVPPEELLKYGQVCTRHADQAAKITEQAYV